MISCVVVHGHPRPARFDHDLFLSTLHSLLSSSPEPITVETRPPLLETHDADERSRRAAGIAVTRVLDPFKPPHPRVVCSILEAQDEESVLAGERAPIGRPPPDGVLYDAARLMTLARGLIPAPERRLDTAHIVLTDRLIGTYQASDRRYHARVVLAAGPHLLSTSGIVEAPARPPGYYLAKQNAGPLLGSDAALEDALHGEIVVHGDPRIPRYMAGYAMQAVFWQAFGDAFCAEPGCVLFNAHWQHEVVHAHGDTPKLCDAHEQRLAAP